MRNLNIGLSAGQLERRQGFLGASDANTLMNGSPEDVYRLYQEKRGEISPEDLSGILPVVMGQWTEELNRYWFERMMGVDVTAEGDARTHPDYPFMACTLDGLTLTQDGHDAVFEAKHVNAWSKMEDVAARYMPQLHHAMAVTGLRWSVLSVFLGTQNYDVAEIPRDDWYLAQLIDREKTFWTAVQNGEPPEGMAPVAAPAMPTKMREVDMSGSNEWTSLAVDWRENRDAAKAFDKAAKGLKGLVEPDVGLAFGAGIRVKRAKNGALSISEMKQ